MEAIKKDIYIEVNLCSHLKRKNIKARVKMKWAKNSLNVKQKRKMSNCVCFSSLFPIKTSSY